VYETNILIVGAGPTGLLAIELARRSIAFRLVETAQTPFAGSRGKGIQPGTLEVFHDLGIIEKILKTGMPYPEVRVHLGPLSLRLGPLGGRHQATETVPYPNLWLVPQNRTEAILRESLAELGGQVEFGTAFESVEQDEQGITVRLSTGESLRAKYLVACDGGHSAVRKAVGFALHGEALLTNFTSSQPWRFPILTIPCGRHKASSRTSRGAAQLGRGFPAFRLRIVEIMLERSGENFFCREKDDCVDFPAMPYFFI
jgi:2-polyprenyl-6-methoxyphenol hydroxylase-like FAD-dependent oxidoreductase